MTMKFKLGPNGFLFPADPSARNGMRTGTSIQVLEIEGVPEGMTFKEVAKRVDLTFIPGCVLKIQFTQLGKDLRERSSWPDLRRAPKELKEKWKTRKR